MVSVLEEPVRGRMKEGVGKDSWGTLIKTGAERYEVPWKFREEEPKPLPGDGVITEAGRKTR